MAIDDLLSKVLQDELIRGILGHVQQVIVGAFSIGVVCTEKLFLIWHYSVCFEELIERLQGLLLRKVVMLNLIVIITAGGIGKYGVRIGHLIKLFLYFVAVCAVFVGKTLRSFLLEGQIDLLMRGSVLQIQHRVQIKLHAQASRSISVLRGFRYGSLVVCL